MASNPKEATEQKKDQGAPLARTAANTPGPWTQSRWGNGGFEIQGGGHSVAIVGRVQAKRLDYLNGVRSKAAKHGEPAHQAEAEAQRLEARDLLPDAKLIAAAPALADALEAMCKWIGPPPDDRESFDSQREDAWKAARSALRLAGRLP